MAQIKITNESVYNAKVVDVELNLETTKVGFRGDVTIELNEGEPRTFWGEHGAFDYEGEFGFIITNE